MLFWYLGLSFALVLMVFDSPLLDYRLVMLGSVLPWLDYLWGPALDAWPMHSLLFPVLVMALVMTVASGRRLIQRRWIGLAIGLFMHLVLAATFATRELFWWPFSGLSVDATPWVPPAALAIVLELVGVGVLFWLFRRLDLADRRRRETFASTGHIDRSFLRT